VIASPKNGRLDGSVELSRPPLLSRLDEENLCRSQPGDNSPSEKSSTLYSSCKPLRSCSETSGIKDELAEIMDDEMPSSAE
jgi:hypothetical protein